ncbi:M13 family metallopeptidase [Kordiimonas sp. SCSIO 12603]|uniref:M13 family metallopeptidase n=1 Tax=Kordiimonas sp. SCSIO 12603 TaxID=2829596 RepID=UPI00210668AF|nr:M13 family metallopeptidase [Kordiimonas sp. SCSIO 12603]UTW59788.1 M13 family metallopeptidase [Kordiimonas sp. SCSIO 12603]
MKNTLKSAVAVSALMFTAACFDTEPEQAVAIGKDKVVADVPKPQIGAWGVDLSAIKESVRPGDDFYEYVNGVWLDTTEIPSDKAHFGPYSTLNDRVLDHVRNIVDELVPASYASGTVEQKITDYYHSYVNIEKLNELGVKPLQPRLREIKQMASVDDLSVLLGKYYIRSPLSFSPQRDTADPSRYYMEVYYFGFGLPDKEYYLSEDERFIEIRKVYLSYVEKMLGFVGEDQFEQKAREILALETEMAKIQWDRKDIFDSEKTYNPINFSDLALEYPNFNWTLLFEAAGYDKFDNLNIYQPSAIKGFIKLLNEQSIETWQAYLAYRLITSNYEFLSQEIYDAYFDFHGVKLAGGTTPPPRWKRGVENIYYSDALGDALGKIYVARHFPEYAKDQVSEMTENLRTVFGKQLESTDLIGDATRAEALKKLQTLEKSIGYPDQWRDHTSIQMKPDDLYSNTDALKQAYRKKNINRLKVGAYKDDTRLFPFAINAFFDPQGNRIMFPAGILQPPYFDPAADMAVNYGAIGSVIGHEIGHGYDRRGSRFDSAGVSRNWWSADDLEKFTARTNMLVEQYSKFEALPDQFINGELTVHENAADLIGLRMAYDAYHLALDGKEAPIIDGLTGDQRFFLAFAQSYKHKYRDENLHERLKTDSHAPAKFRVNGVVRNIPEWYVAFDVKEGDALYLPPEKRVSIW